MERDESPRLRPAFPDPVLGTQRSFRVLLEAMAHPGRVVPYRSGLDVPPPLCDTSGAACLTLLDFETPLWTDLAPETEAVAWLRFHCGCPFVGAEGSARFALVTRPGEFDDPGRFDVGDDESPERSATLIVQTRRLEPGRGVSLEGPGIQGRTRLEVSDVTEAFWLWRRKQREDYPLGVDLIFCTDGAVAALPRSTRVEV